jgi:hypothetical protein
MPEIATVEREEVVESKTSEADESLVREEE